MFPGTCNHWDQMLRVVLNCPNCQTTTGLKLPKVTQRNPTILLTGISWPSFPPGTVRILCQLNTEQRLLVCCNWWTVNYYQKFPQNRVVYVIEGKGKLGWRLISRLIYSLLITISIIIVITISIMMMIGLGGAEGWFHGWSTASAHHRLQSFQTLH